MCDTFCMEFKQSTGIVAWADSSLYQTFAGSAMQEGDFWKIHLGRRIELDDDDLDGSQFLEDLLEDALLFPLRSDLSNRTHERWETVEETPGIWVTRPMASLEVEVEDDSDDMDDNSSDDNEHGDGTDAGIEARSKLERRDWVYQHSSAIRPDTYEDEPSGADTADVNVDGEAQDDDDVQMSDPGWSFNPQVMDAAWPTILKCVDDDDNEEEVVQGDGESDDEKSQTTVDTSGDESDSDSDDDAYGNMAVDDFDVSSTADSDFDSDEVLSGDEAIGL